MNNLFTYGSLVVPDVMKVVTQKSFEYASAQLHGYSRYIFKNHAYPGIIHTGTGITGGVVYFDLDDESIARLDYFEDEFYDRRTVDVRLNDGLGLQAMAYVVSDNHAHLLGIEEWDEGNFISQSLVGFLEETKHWMENYKASI